MGWPTGFALARYLIEVGVDVVAAPSKLQRASGDRVKTDLAMPAIWRGLLHLGEIMSVTIPSVEQARPAT
jgi:transposase